MPDNSDNNSGNDSNEESDFGFNEEVISSESEEDNGSLTADEEGTCLSLGEKLASWSTKNELTRSCLN